MKTIEELKDYWSKILNDKWYVLVYAQTENKWLKLIGARIPNMSIEEFKKLMNKAKKNISPEMEISPFKIDITKYFEYEAEDELLEKPEWFEWVKWEEMFTLL